MAPPDELLRVIFKAETLRPSPTPMTPVTSRTKYHTYFVCRSNRLNGHQPGFARFDTLDSYPRAVAIPAIYADFKRDSRFAAVYYDNFVPPPADQTAFAIIDLCSYEIRRLHRRAMNWISTWSYFASSGEPTKLTFSPPPFHTTLCFNSV